MRVWWHDDSDQVSWQRMRYLSKTQTLIVFLTICLMLWIIPACVCQGRNNVIVSIEAAGKVSENFDFTARVNIVNVTNFDAANYDITYDPAIIEVTDVTGGLIGGATIPVEMWRVIESGKIRLINNVPGIAGVSGSGYLADIRFHVIGSTGNTSHISLSNGVLSNNSANEIFANWASSSVSVSPVITPQ